MAKKKNVRELSPKEKLKLLTMVNWSYKEIMAYFGFGKNKAKCKALFKGRRHQKSKV